MPLETATYINELVTTNPAPSDGMNGADDHMRLTKAALKNTFPNVTGAVTATQDVLNAAGVAAVSGVALLADAGAFFKTSGDGFANSIAGDIDVKLGGQVAATFQFTGGVNFFKVTGQIEATTLKGGGMVPIGAVLIWPSDTLPPTTEGTFAWCNGAIYAKAAYPTCSDRIGGSVDANNFAVPNYQEVTLVGKSGMGGATAPGLLASIATGVKTLLGALFGSDTHTQTANEMPVHFHSASIYDPGHAHGTNSNAGSTTTGGGSFPAGAVNAATINAAATGVRVNSSNGIDTTYSAGGGAAFNITQPSRLVNYIIRLA